MPTAFGQLLLRHPWLGGAVAIGSIVAITDVSAGLDPSGPDLDPWAVIGGVVLMLYSGALALWFPRIIRRRAGDVVEVSLAFAIASFLMAWLARNLGASDGLLYAGAVEGGLLVVLVLVRATKASARRTHEAPGRAT